MIRIRTVRTLVNVVRVWYGCSECGMYGSATVDKTWRPVDFVARLNIGHRCTTAAGAS